MSTTLHCFVFLTASSQNMLSATEMELEGLRAEHDNLRSKADMQATELRALQKEVSGLRAARDKLVEELQVRRRPRQRGQPSG